MVQRDAIARFAASENCEVVGEFVEVETGKGADALDRRPKLATVLAQARTGKAVVAKLCCLSHDVVFISGLMAQRVPFMVAKSLSGNKPRNFNDFQTMLGRVLVEFTKKSGKFRGHEHDKHPKSPNFFPDRL